MSVSCSSRTCLPVSPWKATRATASATAGCGRVQLGADQFGVQWQREVVSATRREVDALASGW